MGHLDELKRQASQRREEEAAREADLHRRERQIRRMEPAVAEVARFLKDLAEELNYVDPDVFADYTVERMGELPHMRQTDYQVAHQGQGEGAVVLRFRCVNKRLAPLVADLPSKVEFDHLRDYLWRNKLSFRQKLSVSGAGTLIVDPDVPVFLRFAPDPEQAKIRFDVVNHLGIGRVTRWIDPMLVEPHALDDVAGLVLGKLQGLPHLARDELDPAVRERLRAEAERQKALADMEHALGAEAGGAQESGVWDRVRFGVSTLGRRLSRQGSK